jgi:hypothetical protein
MASAKMLTYQHVRRSNVEIASAERWTRLITAAWTPIAAMAALIGSWAQHRSPFTGDDTNVDSESTAAAADLRYSP